MVSEGEPDNEISTPSVAPTVTADMFARIQGQMDSMSQRVQQQIDGISQHLQVLSAQLLMNRTATDENDQVLQGGAGATQSQPTQGTDLQSVRRVSRLPIMAFEPPIFDDSRPSEGFLHVEVFIKKLESAMPAESWSDEERRLGAMQRLRGDAAVRIEQLPPAEVNTWAKLRATLIRMFTISDMTLIGMCQDYAPQMREGESVKEFITRAMKDLESLDPYSEMPEKTRWSRVKSLLERSLPREMQYLLYGNKRNVNEMTDTLQEAWEGYQRHARETRINPQVAAAAPQVVPQIAPQVVPQIAPQVVPQVVPQTLPQMATQFVSPPIQRPFRGGRGRGWQGPSSYRGRGRGHGYGEQRDDRGYPQPQCHRCGRFGHVQAQCSMTQCYACGRKGHYAKDCRSSRPKNGGGRRRAAVHITDSKGHPPRAAPSGPDGSMPKQWAPHQ